MTSTPAAAICELPMPRSRTPGASSRRARQRVAPWRSPEASPAETGMSGSANPVNAHHRDARLVGPTDHLVPLEEEHTTTLHPEGDRPAFNHRGEGGGPDRGDVEAIVLRLGCA